MWIKCFVTVKVVCVNQLTKKLLMIFTNFLSLIEDLIKHWLIHKKKTPTRLIATDKRLMWFLVKGSYTPDIDIFSFFTLIDNIFCYLKKMWYIRFKSISQIYEWHYSHVIYQWDLVIISLNRFSIIVWLGTSRSLADKTWAKTKKMKLNQ